MLQTMNACHIHHFPENGSFLGTVLSSLVYSVSNPLVLALLGCKRIVSAKSQAGNNSGIKRKGLLVLPWEVLS